MLNLTEMTREEAIDNISTAMDESKDIVERRVDYLDALSIVNIHNYNIPIEKPKCKPWVSPYAKFDRIRRKRK